VAEPRAPRSGGPRPRPRPRPRRSGPVGGETSPPESLVARIDAARPGVPPPDTVPSGFPSLDRMLGGGFRRQDLVVLAGDIGSGKSALALAMALRASRLGHPTVYFSGEMGEERLRERTLAIEGKAAIDDLRQGRLDEATRAAIGAAALSQRDLPLRFVPLPEGSPDELEAALQAVPRPRLAIVDYLQLVPPPSPAPGRAAARQEERAALATRALKALAVRRDVALLLVAQLPHHRPDRPDPRPTLADLGARGAVKQHADLVLGLYREEMYRPGHGIEGAAELIVLKNRNGPTGFADLYFHRRWLRFEDLLDRE